MHYRDRAHWDRAGVVCLFVKNHGMNASGKLNCTDIVFSYESDHSRIRLDVVEAGWTQCLATIIAEWESGRRRRMV